jgi:hypothetical protein
MNARRTILLTLLCLLIACMALPAGCSDEGATAAVNNTNTSPDKKVYTNFGFSFQYPKGWTISEMGMLQSQADGSSGLVQATKSYDKLLQVAWVGMVEDLFEMTGGLEVTLEDSFSGLLMDGSVNDLEKGEIVETTHQGHYLMYQDFAADGYAGESIRGVVGCFYCDDSERVYQVMTGDTSNVSKSVVLNDFQVFLDSLICH